MGALTASTPASTYKGLLWVDNSNSGIDATLRVVEDGAGNDSPIKLSTGKMLVIPPSADTANFFEVQDTSANAILSVNTSTATVDLTGLATTQLLLPLSNDATTPTLAFGDGDTGLYEFADDRLGISIAGDLRYIFEAGTFYGDAGTGAPLLTNVQSSSTVPSYAFSDDTNTGLGRGGVDTLNLIAGGTNILEVATSGASIAGHIGNDAQQTITLGAAATTFAVTKNVVQVTGDAGTNTIATITGASVGIYTFIFTDGNVTITDTAGHTANTVDLSAAFTSADDTVLTLVFDGTSWYEMSRSAN